eukprot:16057-Chlamydomonas_euryale.AAC.3
MAACMPTVGDTAHMAVGPFPCHSSAGVCCARAHTHLCLLAQPRRASLLALDRLRLHLLDRHLLDRRVHEGRGLSREALGVRVHGSAHG